MLQLARLELRQALLDGLEVSERIEGIGHGIGWKDVVVSKAATQPRPHRRRGCLQWRQLAARGKSQKRLMRPERVMAWLSERRGEM